MNFPLSQAATACVIGLSFATPLTFAREARAEVLARAETVIGGDLVLLSQICVFHGLGQGLVLRIENARGTTVGSGCATLTALPPELGLMMVQWGDSPVQGEESYRIDSFTLTNGGRIALAPVIAARKNALANVGQNQRPASKLDPDQTIVDNFQNPGQKKAFLGIVQRTKYPSTILIIYRDCMTTLPVEIGGKEVLQ